MRARPSIWNGCWADMRFSFPVTVPSPWSAVQGRQLHELVWRALREHLSERFLGDGVEIVSHAGWIAAEQDMRRHSNQSRYNCKYLALTSHESPT